MGVCFLRAEPGALPRDFGRHPFSHVSSANVSSPSGTSLLVGLALSVSGRTPSVLLKSSLPVTLCGPCRRCGIQAGGLALLSQASQREGLSVGWRAGGSGWAADCRQQGDGSGPRGPRTVPPRPQSTASWCAAHAASFFKVVNLQSCKSQWAVGGRQKQGTIRADTREVPESCRHICLSELQSAGTAPKIANAE